MNPSNTSSTPLQDWTEEKSPMGHPAPPPYQDAPYPGMPPPGPGYPPQQGFPPQYGGPAYGHQPYPMVHQYPAQPGTVTVQPTVFVSAGPLANPVNDYLGYSIFTLLFCCLPLGVAALIYSISAREANHVGDQVTAERSSRMARTLNHVALGLGIGGLILTLVFVKVLLSA
ncbi:interferon-induced transmembrane protein 1-like isoform X1 [Stegastes partitus]|uniref:Interferon-induced transmembrane protein 1-like isoform X1 n=1 Tax=Stegastes partitus TaxID=144197 RepID=A0A9Y4K8X1_9TELE|nr:PREDICTED: interferon-induced transmembrane protein 1-like isoform X1 [Stegastes partitus]